jgi:hypothetical protein
MTTPITKLLATVAGMAAIAGMVGNAWADGTKVLPHAPAELARWRSLLTDGSEPHARPEWKSSLGAIDPVDSADFSAAQGAIDMPQYGFRISPGSFDDTKSTRRPAREPARNVGGKPGSGR